MSAPSSVKTRAQRAVELRERDEVLLVDAGRAAPASPARRTPPRPAVIARRARCRSRAPRRRSTDSRAAAAPLARQPAGRSRRSRARAARRRRAAAASGARRPAREQRGQRTRVEPLAGRARVLRVLPDRLGAERDEPRERVVEPLPDEPLQRLVAARALGAEVLLGQVVARRVVTSPPTCHESSATSTRKISEATTAVSTKRRRTARSAGRRPSLACVTPAPRRVPAVGRLSTIGRSPRFQSRSRSRSAALAR